jgi:hypothetical protein
MKELSPNHWITKTSLSLVLDVDFQSSHDVLIILT